MGRKVTNVNNGTVGIQCGNDDKDDKKKGDKKDTEVRNVNNGTVGIQGGKTSGNTVVINGKRVK